MGEATSPAPIPTFPVEAPSCVADHISFREKLVRRQAEKEMVRAGAELPSSSALAVAPGHGTEGVTPQDTGTLAGSVVPDASASLKWPYFVFQDWPCVALNPRRSAAFMTRWSSCIFHKLTFSARYRLRRISEDVEHKHRGIVLGSRIFWISCLEMLETSALGLGKTQTGYELCPQRLAEIGSDFDASFRRCFVETDCDHRLASWFAFFL
ncbi:hypothetical protein DY000_02058445 [Brassica cretica]|uniref:Uncharacterized protein n=1 Tax=Brassica cretica TaxID=69181 RepID=A0ABQ7B2P7_BRACR|nr:hypothetical protein DY000_02058445 [Brassica cretica]